jgi:hypothetical protein
MLEAHLFPANAPKCQENAAHTQRRLTRGNSCPKFNKQAGWPRRKKMAQQLFSADLALRSIWEKARARDKDR